MLVIAFLARWAGFLALATVVGGLALDLLILPRDPPAVDAARRAMRRLMVLSVIVLALSSAVELVTRAQTMAGGDLGAAIHAVPSVLARTHFGSIWTARFVALGIALLIPLVPVHVPRIVPVILALVFTATTSLTSHAADWGDVTVRAAIDWLHVLLVSAWAGGLLCLTLCVLGPAREWPPPIFTLVARRYSRLAGICLLVVVLTGSYNAWSQLGSVSALWTTFYGRVLAVKLLVFLGLIWLGAVSRYTIVARLGAAHMPGVGERVFRLGRLALRGRRRAPRQLLPSLLRTFVGREAVLVVLVIGCTAVLVDSTPARHASHARHQAMAEAMSEPSSVRVTMEELHGSGGVPPGWMLTPPTGNASRGRDVFVRLGCFACHHVSGEAFPSSSGLGPDLTGVGRHHPAGYLLESILNPNAVIVEGRGYTGADGRSIMPDVRDQLSVTDLIDLVSYLKTL
jgi:putative copper export protein